MSEVVKKFMHVESAQIPLVEVPYEDVKQNCIDPITNKPYKGIVLFGVFADLSGDGPNNNLRYYDIPTYLTLVGELRKQVYSPKGVYGELEHPKSYAVNFNNVSHKILDIFYNPETKQVCGYVLLLNTDNGKKAQEIIRSGGCLAISARAAGEEKKSPDGTKQCKVKILTTYDLVYHPGFNAAVLQFKELNESQKFFDERNKELSYSYIIYDDQVKKLNESYEHFLSINNSNNENSFLVWLGESEEIKESESEEEKQDDKKIQKNQTEKEDKLQDNLQDAAQKDLNESEKMDYVKRLKRKQRHLANHTYRAMFDNSAGFITQGIIK